MHVEGSILARLKLRPERSVERVAFSFIVAECFVSRVTVLPPGAVTEEGDGEGEGLVPEEAKVTLGRGDSERRRGFPWSMEADAE